jgi:hypothetical protein
MTEFSWKNASNHFPASTKQTSLVTVMRKKNIPRLGSHAVK